jgi:hypothetical protein
MRFLAAGLAVLLTAAGAAAADRKVPSANYATIQDAADAAGSGDRILIGKGVYFENVTLTQTNVQVIGKGAIIDGNITGTAGACLTITGDDCKVSGITFRNGTRLLDMVGNDVSVSKCKFLRPYSYLDALRIAGNGAVVTGCTFFGALENAITITGDFATVTKTKVTNSGENGITITGTGATVTKNTSVIVEDGNAITVTGNLATVTSNKVGYTDGDGINVDADNCDVSKNTSVACGNYGIRVRGDVVNVTSNKVTFTVDDADAFRVSSRTAAGTGLIEGNTVSDSVEYGMYLSAINHVVVRHNTALRCGTENEANFYITGDFNTIEDNLSQDGEDDGYYLNGNSNVLTGNKAVNCQTDGFDINGPANSLDTCSATGCGGEGLDNGGTLTSVSNCTFLKNRIDFAADLVNGATFGLGGNNKFDTGNTGTQSQVD